MALMSRSMAAAVAVVVLGCFALAIAPARAEGEGPVIVIPSRPGIPVIINGRDASYAVVEGDWGLSRPGAAVVTVIGGSPVLPNPVYTRRPSYHPRYGRAPERGRNEIEPSADRALPEPAESFSRSWSTSSDVTPVNVAPRATSRSVQPDGPDDAATPPPDFAPATITDPQTYPQNFNPSGLNNDSNNNNRNNSNNNSNNSHNSNNNSHYSNNNHYHNNNNNSQHQRYHHH
jgi:hypothetical protein